MRAGVCAAVVAALLIIAGPAEAGTLSTWSSHGLNRLMYTGFNDGANDVTLTMAADGTSITLTDTAGVSASPPDCLPLGLNAAFCLSLLGGQPFSTLDVNLEDGPGRFVSGPVPVAIAVIGSPEADDLTVGASDWSSISTRGGDDTINVRNGDFDQVDCSAGVDTVIADAAESLRNCENVLLP
jgi:hypothetical protein